MTTHLVGRLRWAGADLRSLERCANDFHPGLVFDLAQINLVPNATSLTHLVRKRGNRRIPIRCGSTVVPESRAQQHSCFRIRRARADISEGVLRIMKPRIDTQLQARTLPLIHRIWSTSEASGSVVLPVMQNLIDLCDV